MPSQKNRCSWCADDPLYVAYHDTEWGVPCHNEQTLFEFLILEGAQAGLSWITVLRKRENYRKAFAGFDAQQIARFSDNDIARLMGDAGIIRNRLKIESAIGNARATCALHDAGQTLHDLFWNFVDGTPVINHWQSLSEVPVFTPAAEALSKELKKKGFRFVGPTVIYSHMQATGMVNDHVTGCFRHKAVQVK
ncbi:MAG: DNA-3-methyladenine glycosylase I [Rhodocyclaceae bacterium]|jgi:DNA-3-methyladenine glycosylase I|nr:DNA-3-methyladenine glycosylase I [Rhodocyclaceae bacterium]